MAILCHPPPETVHPLRLHTWIELSEQILDGVCPGWAYDETVSPRALRTGNLHGGSAWINPRVLNKLCFDVTRVEFVRLYPQVMVSRFRQGKMSTTCNPLMGIFAQLVEGFEAAKLVYPSYQIEVAKRFINFAVGVLGNQHNSFYSPDIGEVPMTVRRVMEDIYERFSNVLYVDTDCLFVNAYEQSRVELNYHLNQLHCPYLTKQFEKVVFLGNRQYLTFQDGELTTKGLRIFG